MIETITSLGTDHASSRLAHLRPLIMQFVDTVMELAPSGTRTTKQDIANRVMFQRIPNTDDYVLAVFSSHIQALLFGEWKEGASQKLASAVSELVIKVAQNIGQKCLIVQHDFQALQIMTPDEDYGMILDIDWRTADWEALVANLQRAFV